MKKIVIGTDGSCKVYLVPDQVAKKLKMYCNQFLDWVYKHERDRFYDGKGFCYNEEDFINYLKEELCFDRIFLVEEIGWISKDKANLPEKYKECPFYNFL